MFKTTCETCKTIITVRVSYEGIKIKILELVLCIPNTYDDKP